MDISVQLDKIYRWCRRRKVLISWSGILLASFTTIFFGIIGFKRLQDPPLPFSTLVYLSLQLFTLDSGALTEVHQLNWFLQIARWSGVFASLGAVTNTVLFVFSKRINSWVLQRISNHIVVCGASQTGMRLAMDFLNDGKQVVVIDSVYDGAKVAKIVDSCGYELIGDARDRSTLRAAAIQNAQLAIVTTESDTKNLAIYASIKTVCIAQRTQATPLRCYLHIVDRRIRDVIDIEPVDHNSFVIEATTFNRFTNCSRHTLEYFPLDRGGITCSDKSQVHLIIFGLTDLGEALLWQALAIGHYANQLPIAITIIDADASRKEAKLIKHCPELHLCGKLEFIDGSLEDSKTRNRVLELLQNCSNIATVAICLHEKESVLAACLDVIPMMTDHNNVLFLNLDQDECAALPFRSLSGCPIRLVSFGNAEVSCGTAYVMRDEIDDLAKKIHERYRTQKAREGNLAQEHPAMKPWNLLSGEYREMNRQQADHIPVKLRALKCQMIAKPSGDGRCQLIITESDLESLARAEHLRWCACRRLAGWRWGNHRDEGAKIHPNLVPWEDLNEATREFDREPIRHLPELLNSVGYRIEKLGLNIEAMQERNPENEE